MAYNQQLADWARKVPAQWRRFLEGKVFVGNAFLVRENMRCAAVNRELIHRRGAGRVTEGELSGNPASGFYQRFVGLE